MKGRHGIAHRWPLVARAYELGEAVAALTGAGPGVLVVGEAGAGKTSLAAEAAGVVRAEGGAVFWVLGSAVGGAVPLGALASLLPAGAGHDVEQGAIGRALDVLGGLGGGHPASVVLDDAHLLDHVSASVVAQLVADGRWRVLVTARVGQPLPDPFGRTGRLNRVDLWPLDASATADLVGALLGGAGAPATARRIHRVTQGNPLFVREFVASCLETGALVPGAGGWALHGPMTVAPRLADLVTARLARLDGEQREVVELLAVAESLGLALLTDLVEPDAVEELERHGLVVTTVSQRRRTARLVHPLHGEVLRATMPVTTRGRLSGRLADTVEKLGLRRHDDLPRWSMWRLDGGGRIDPTLMITAARRGVVLGGDPAVCLRLARCAWQECPDQPAALVLAQALFMAGRADDAEAVLAEVAARGEPIEPDLTVARAWYLGWGAGRVDAAIALLDAAAATGPAAAHPAARALRAALAAARGDVREALRDAVPLLSSTAPEVRGWAAYAATVGHLLAAEFGQADQLMPESPGPTAGLSTVETRTAAAVTASQRLFVVGFGADLGRALLLGEEALQSAADDPQGYAWTSAALASLCLHAGDIARSRALAGAAAAAFAEQALPSRRAWGLALGLIGAAAAGDVPAVDALWSELEPVAGSVGQHALCRMEVERAEAWRLIAHTDTAAAVDVLTAAAEWWLERGGVLAVTLMAADLCRVGEPGPAAAILDRAVVPAGWPAGQAIRAYVMAAAARDRHAVTAAAQRLDELGFGLGAAEAAAHAALLWRDRGGADTSGAARARTTARILATRCGGLRTPLAMALGAPSGLTARERHVADLAAAGLTNRAIAERLGLSERTIENHLNRTYAKLGVPGRGHLAVRFAENGY
jgi:DNA-binding CsgD family transcriptional regulator